SVAAHRLTELVTLAAEAEVPLVRLGMVNGEELTVGDSIHLSVDEMDRAWRGGLEEVLK
ncbi:MAG: hypothetical protein HW403_941, partial [Dehalococcoidia bacterium]|nr:hypothetical protein [Dehalococcoidia bacterium]